MTDCLNAPFYVSIKVISSKQNLGTINPAVFFKKPRLRYPGPEGQPGLGQAGDEES